MSNRFGPRTRFGGLPFGGRVAQWMPQFSLIKSVQAGAIDLNNATSATATLSPEVNTANTMLFFLGFSTALNTGNTPQQGYCALALTNSTTVTASRAANPGASAQNVNWAALEFKAGVIKSIQRGTIVVDTATSNTAAITAVNTAKSLVQFLGQVSADTNTGTTGWNPTQFQHTVALTNATTVTAARVTAGTISYTVSYQVVEFY